MKRKIVKTICAFICAMGFLVTIGSVGSVETGMLTLGRGLIQAVIGLVLFSGAGFLGGFMQ